MIDYLTVGVMNAIIHSVEVGTKFLIFPNQRQTPPPHPTLVEGAVASLIGMSPDDNPYHRDNQRSDRTLWAQGFTLGVGVTGARERAEELAEALV